MKHQAETPETEPQKSNARIFKIIGFSLIAAAVISAGSVVAYSINQPSAEPAAVASAAGRHPRRAGAAIGRPERSGAT